MGRSPTEKSHAVGFSRSRRPRRVHRGREKTLAVPLGGGGGILLFSVGMRKRYRNEVHVRSVFMKGRKLRAGLLHLSDELPGAHSSTFVPCSRDMSRSQTHKVSPHN